MNAVAPLKLPFVAVSRTARLGRTLAGRLTLPALGAAVGGVAWRTLHRNRSAMAPASEAKVAVTPEPGHSVVDAIDPEVGVVLASELPIHSYDALAAKDAVQMIRELSDPEEVRIVLRFEEENAKRATVLTAAHGRLNALQNATS